MLFIRAKTPYCCALQKGLFTRSRAFRGDCSARLSSLLAINTEACPLRSPLCSAAQCPWGFCKTIQEDIKRVHGCTLNPDFLNQQCVTPPPLTGGGGVFNMVHIVRYASTYKTSSLAELEMVSVFQISPIQSYVIY